LAVSLRTRILADTPQDADSIVAGLRQGGFAVNPTLVRTQQEFRAAIAEEHFDAVLADYRAACVIPAQRASRVDPIVAPRDQ
jgi:hypothetical protein